VSKALRILLTNDDGYPAEGLRCLFCALSRRHDVTVVAPKREQSGASHAFTYHSGIHCEALPASEEMPGYIVDGTPCDCVKLAIGELLKAKPDMVVSGINMGENTGIAGHYSGTLAGAREGAFWEVVGVAFSVCEEGVEHMTACADAASHIIDKLQEIHTVGFRNERHRVFFNVNFPACGPRKSKGVKITRQSMAFFNDQYRSVAGGVSGAAFWLYGSRKEPETSDNYDTRALHDGYVAITPLDIDATAEEALEQIEDLEKTRLYLGEQ